MSAQFDEHAKRYEDELDQGLSVSGESRDYFATQRLSWLKQCLGAATPERVMDFGCGDGATIQPIAEILAPGSIVGADVSSESIAQARAKHSSPATQFEVIPAYQPSSEFDLVYANGIFHHIPPAERLASMAYVYRALRPKGLFSLWDNNPWNPGARLVMWRIPFDRDAIMLSAASARRLGEAAGFKVLRVDHLFLFPHALRALRGLEPRLSHLPLGAQFQVLLQRE